MPTYEYQCKACGHELEAFQNISDEPLKVCPKCHAEALGKLLSAPNFHLKGTGWYATDFKDKGKPKEPQKATEGNKNETNSAENAKKEDKKPTDQSQKTGES